MDRSNNIMEYQQYVEESHKYRNEGIDIVVLDPKAHTEMRQTILDHIDNQFLYTEDRKNELQTNDFRFFGITYTKQTN